MRNINDIRHKNSTSHVHCQLSYAEIVEMISAAYVVT